MPNSALNCWLTIVVMLGCLTLVIAISADAVLPFRLLCSEDLPKCTAPAALLGSATLARFVDGLVTPLLYRRACEPFTGAEKQAVTQWQGSCSIAVTAVCTWLAVYVVKSGIVN